MNDPADWKEPTAEEQAIIDQRDFEAARERVRRCEAGESPSVVYDVQERRIAQMGNDYRRIAQAYFAAFPDEDAELCDQEWLEARKFKFDTRRNCDDPDSLSLEVSPTGLEVTVTIDKEGGATHLSLGWMSRYRAENGLFVGFTYSIDDRPTKGQVRKLLEVFGQ